MQASLFDTEQSGERIALEDATLDFYPDFYSSTVADQLFDQLRNTIPWRQEEIRIAGLQRLQPRLSAWYGDAEAEYTYSGLHLKPLTWSKELLEIKVAIERRTGCQFNSVLLNYYRDQQDSMGWHSDDEPELGLQPIIASLSLGGTREFALKHKFRKELRYKIPLAHGSLLIMSGSTQSHWQHAIAKEKHLCQARINLTFRQIISNR
jgi:alkylated DNA repair dioxygenase AlkB